MFELRHNLNLFESLLNFEGINLNLFECIFFAFVIDDKVDSAKATLPQDLNRLIFFHLIFNITKYEFRIFILPFYQ